MKAALLVLEDGRIFRGRRFGADSDAQGEVVFNTSMMGYQEILTDPSYAGQIVTMTYPMIGNYGIAGEDFEARKIFLGGLIVKEISRISSNWRSEVTLDEYLKRQGIPGFCDIDTRALVRHLRDKGAMRGIIADAEGADEQALIAKAKGLTSMAGTDLAKVVTAGHQYSWTEKDIDLAGTRAPAASPDEKAQPHVVAYDFGVKRGILRQLAGEGCRVTVVPASTTAEEVMTLNPDGVLLSNGPGDPEPVDYAIENVKALIGKVPIFGICLGHQILALASGGSAFKLKFGHRGGNHPVQDLKTGKIEITSQNHGFCVDPDSLPKDEVEVTHINLNDKTCAGIRLKNAPAFSVQYHPEASPGPHDANYLFDRFMQMMREWNPNRGF
ncbi:MAG: glutamine-hydrolyzing carbamoyl-phosphate synthase small subunit [Deltaproteobacteria bacterium]|jgi:carbamoyl-phosphate synthase small subunit|nr:glutamine-hydrolyzing carbamoyl-phosphate synthase small subunit [Deltaproteobacteria bacterium]MBT6432522.1 glutamine-hydrolyzing carbamoyl-phosphate synthase small subunit [Deltaproteobacteria bacterium]MBT6488204.1 glutamine-hydrolyzing carbamoyl-phosphate synthase small subunit [Deltaproteobacteria bacterium]